jgi:hypothetical protein
MARVTLVFEDCTASGGEPGVTVDTLFEPAASADNPTPAQVAAVAALRGVQAVTKRVDYAFEGRPSAPGDRS